ncbi:MAG: hypothetical protein AB8H80_04490 [Planctomycetota bacterium]
MPIDPHSLLPLAYRAATEVVRSPILAEEASERAVHQLALAMLEGDPPDQPKAWLRVVARRSACALLRSGWARTKAMDLAEVASPYPQQDERQQRSSWVREQLGTELTPRQRQALDAAMSCNTTRAAARNCGMQPRDFRRSLGSISRRARRLLEREPERGPEAPGAELGMQC